ncbi:MAG: hypothetical protein ACK4YP_23095, partial [Myxococcota bacterium]
RLHVGPVPVITGTFPLAVRRGEETQVRVTGVNLGPGPELTVAVRPAERAKVGSKIAVPVRRVHHAREDHLLAHSTRWGDLGCRGHAGYDGIVAMALASRGLWDEAADVAATARHNDTKRRDEIVRAAVEARDGDLTTYALRAMNWPGGAADLTVQVSTLLQARHAPRPTTAGAGVGTPAEAPTAP